MHHTAEHNTYIMFKKGTFKNVKNKLKSTTSSSNVGIKSAKTSPVKGVDPRLFDVTLLSKYGVSGNPVYSAFNQSQSLLAVGTNTGCIHVYGQNQVEMVLKVESRKCIGKIIFMKGVYLVATDVAGTISVFSLMTSQLLTSFTTPSHVTCLEADPSLDWLLIGLEDGSVCIYDVDRNYISITEINNHQQDFLNTKSKFCPVHSIQWNPRDLGMVLISYDYITITFSLTEKAVQQHFFYEVPADAPGGDYNNVNRKRTPKVIQSLYHPNGLHILTIHEDNSLVFWDAQTGQLIQARNSFETHVNIPQPGCEGSMPRVSTIYKAFWNCEADPEYTSLLLAYNSTMQGGTQSLVYMDFGVTPKYSITSYDQMSEIYANPKNQKLIPLEYEALITNILPLPRKSPYFNGCHDPGLFLITLENGQMETLLYPSGVFTQLGSLFPYPMSWMRSLITCSKGYRISYESANKLFNTTKNAITILHGGIPPKVIAYPCSIVSVLFTGNNNGVVRMSQIAKNGAGSNALSEINISTLLNKSTATKIVDISFAPETLELSVAVDTGDIILLRFQKNIMASNSTKELEIKLNRFSLNGMNDGLIDIQDRAPKNVGQGFMPVSILHVKKRRKVTALCNSNIGFMAAAYEDGTITVVDRRGPMIIFKETIKNICNGISNYVTSLSFAIMQLGSEGYSSILLYCGTDAGELIILRVIPGGNGRYVVQPVNASQVTKNGSVENISCILQNSNESCDANLILMGKLSSGTTFPGYIVASCRQEIRVLKSSGSGVSSQSLGAPIVQAMPCHIPIPASNGNVRETTTHVMACLLVTGDIEILSLPDLKKIRTLNISKGNSSKIVGKSCLIDTGKLILRQDVHQAVAISLLTGQLELAQVGESCSLFNSSISFPKRPQVGTVQWINHGAGVCTPEQLDQIFGGEDRPVSKYKESAIVNGMIRKPSMKASYSSDRTVPTELHYKKPVRYNGQKTGYSMVGYASKAVENYVESWETSIDDYTTALGKQIDDAMEDTTKDLMKSAIGF